MAKKQLIEFSSELYEEIDKIAKIKEKSRADVIRQALALYFVANESLEKNKKERRVAIIENDKIIERYVLI